MGLKADYSLSAAGDMRIPVCPPQVESIGPQFHGPACRCFVAVLIGPLKKIGNTRTIWSWSSYDNQSKVCPIARPYSDQPMVAN